MSALDDAITRAKGLLSADQVIACIDAYNAGVALAQEEGLDEVPIVYEHDGISIRLAVDPEVGPDAILAIEALIECIKTDLDDE